MNGDIANNVAAVRERIAASAARAGRRAQDVRLVAVTKTVGSERVAEAVAAGVTEFGENYVQEARGKIPAVADLTETPPIWHLIGHLQSNKAKYSVELFSLIHSVHNYQIAQELGRLAEKQGKTQSVLIEVNLTESPARPGISPGGALALAERVAAVPGVALWGLMGMAPFSTGALAPLERAKDARPFFARLRALFEPLPSENRQALSMGMSGDFEVAVEEGATIVRVGTAIFGQRQVG